MTNKYHNLPDINTDDPDVYETADPDPVYDIVEVDFCDANGDDGESRHDIIRMRTSVKAVSEKLRQAVVDAEDVDFSDSLTIRKKTMYKTYTSTEQEYEIIPRGEMKVKETIHQKLKRLMLEVNEVGEEIEKEKEATKGKSTAGAKVNPSVILNELSVLESQLESYNTDLSSPKCMQGTPLLASTPSTLETVSNLNSKKMLMNHLKNFRESSVSATSSSTNVANANTKGEGEPGAVKYELYYAPETSSILRSTKLSELDHRLSVLEKFIGLSSISTGEVPPTPLIPLLNRLDHHLSLLTQPRNLDIVLRKLKQLSVEMDRIGELRKNSNTIGFTSTQGERNENCGIQLGNGGVVSRDIEGKITHLFNITQQLDPLINLAPQLLTRLQQLQKLHHEATEFSDGLKNVLGGVERTEKGIKELEELFKTLEKSVELNTIVVEKNVARIEERMKDVVKKADMCLSKVTSP